MSKQSDKEQQQIPGQLSLELTERTLSENHILSERTFSVSAPDQASLVFSIRAMIELRAEFYKEQTTPQEPPHQVMT